MDKLKLSLIPISTGLVLLLYSWASSYPVSITSTYDFGYNHFSYLYWISLPMLLASFFIVAMKTKNHALRWVMAVSTVLLIFSQTYFYYTIPTSDANLFLGLTENFIATGNLGSPNFRQSYYQWPLFFVMNKMMVLATGIDLRIAGFILYALIGSIITSFLYFLLFKVQENAYVAVVAFFIILTWFVNFQFWAPFALSLCFTLVLFYLDHLPRKREVTVAMLVIFGSITFTHILTPLFFVVYSLIMHLIYRSRKHRSLFVLTSIVYVLVLMWNVNLNHYIEQALNLTSGSLLGQIEVTMTGTVAQQPYVDLIAQLLSRTGVVATILLTGFGFILLYRRKKLSKMNYAMLITGGIFAATFLIGPANYNEITSRSLFLICLPASLGASFLCESKFRKYFTTVFLILLVLFTFSLMHKTFFDRQVFFLTKQEYNCANFVVETTNWNVSTTFLTDFRLNEYLGAKSLSVVVRLESDVSSPNFYEDISSYDNVIYTVGLAKSFYALGLSPAESFEEFNKNDFNLIYNSGEYTCVFQK